MRINVAQQLKESVGSVRQYEIRGSSDEGFPVTGEVRLLRTNRSILVTGKLETTVRSVCSRCLDEFDYILTLDIEEEYFPTRDALTGQALPPPPESIAFTIDDNHILDLTEAVRQYTIIAQPMKPICKEDCLGLCPNCGGNLNQGPCQCTPVQRDPRWSQLQILLSGEKKPTER